MWSIVEFVVLDYPSVRSGTLSAHWALHNATGAVALGAVFAMLFWFLVTRPLLRRVQGSKRLACGNATGNCVPSLGLQPQAPVSRLAARDTQ
jgi:hypothetical protein